MHRIIVLILLIISVSGTCFAEIKTTKDDFDGTVNSQSTSNYDMVYDQNIYIIRLSLGTVGQNGHKDTEFLSSAIAVFSRYPFSIINYAIKVNDDINGILYCDAVESNAKMDKSDNYYKVIAIKSIMNEMIKQKISNSKKITVRILFSNPETSFTVTLSPKILAEWKEVVTAVK